MPSRKINTRSKKAIVTAVASTETLGEILASVLPKKRALDASDPIVTAIPATELPADIDPALAADSDLTLAEKLYLHSLPDEPTPSEPAIPAVPDAKAKFIERKSAATLSVLPVYNGPSLSVHRSDKIPAAAAYLERVAQPVQRAKSPTIRDDSALLSYYDHLTDYHGGDYLAGFNPDSFGADLGALSRNASLNRVALSDDKQHVVLTPIGIVNARNLVAKRAK